MDNSEDNSDYYECVLTPNNAPADSKTGVTFKGKDAEYLKAHKIIMTIAQNKGDRYNINDTEVNIADAPKNKPACVEIKPKFGQTGKANLKIYAKNGRGYGTIHITKISKGDFEHVKILAFKVVKYLLDKIIAGELQNEDMEKMKNKAGSKIGKKVYHHCCKSCGSKFATDQDLIVHMKTDHTEKKVMCDSCENNFLTLEELEQHEKQKHTSNFKHQEFEDHKQNKHEQNSFKCQLCEHKFKDEKDFEDHKQNNHAGMCSPTSKRIKTNTEICDEEEEKMEVEESYEMRSKKQDEKVILIQKKFNKEHEKMNELKRKKSIQKEEEDYKKKKLSLKKKKSKRKNKKERNEEISQKIKLEEIPKQYDEIFKESGKNRQDFGLFSVKPDGACGANSTALHCHRDQNLGPYVMRNVNQFTVDFWPFFQEYFQFPIEVKVGSKTVKYDDEKKFLDFLRSGRESGYMWMEHQGWQVVANMYKIKINILTLLPMVGKGEPRARWTYIFPDERLSKFSSIHKGLPDMWIMHVDEAHYDLMVHKDSELAKEGSVENIAVSEVENEKGDQSPNGPGYMGWELNDKIENKLDESDTKKTLVELIEWYSDIKKEIANLKKEAVKREKKQEAEIKMMKEEFTKCLHELKNETYARTKAETLAKVLQDTLDAKNELEKVDKIEEMEIDMQAEETEEEGGKWEKQRSEKRRMKRNRSLHGNRDSMLYCKECGKTFSSKTSLKEHEQEHVMHLCKECNKNFQNENEMEMHLRYHKENRNSFNDGGKYSVAKSSSKKQTQKQVMFACEVCKDNFVSENDLKDHRRKHTENEFNCNECSEIFTSKKLLLDHVKDHVHPELEQSHKSNKEPRRIESYEKQIISSKYQCSKCDNNYFDMRKLRRHDWRAHREIECSICMETLTSRQQLKEHRQQVHKMLKKIPCRFYPECYDEDECLFEHINLTNGEISDNLCPNGQSCSNQECLFTEKQHKFFNNNICKFQAQCNRAGCQFRHNVKRNTFLELRLPPKGKV